MKVLFVSLGCDKNRVDSEVMLGMLSSRGYEFTDNEELVYKLYARKQGTYFVNKVFSEWGMDVLRPDLIERARKMTRARSNNHPWLSMDDEELLRSAGLYEKNLVTGQMVFKMTCFF